MSTLRDKNLSTAEKSGQAESLRATMVAELRQLGVIRSVGVAEAVARVPRHVFALGEPLERAYAVKTILQTKRDERGVAISMVSAPDIQAMMLEQAQLGPGMRVLEIGSGGYNAALIAELVGKTGQVTTVDIDPDVVDRAQRCLRAAGYEKVNVVLADADGGVPEHAPYDRVIATTSAWDIPPAWTDQLAEGGRIVVPLRMRGLTRSVVFERDGDRLVSQGYELCSFMPMQGIGTPTERLVSLDGDEVSLRVDGNQPIDADRLRAALSQPRVQAWSGVTSGADGRFDGLHLWLAMVVPTFGVLMARKEAVVRGVIAHAWALGIPTAVEGGSFAYLGLSPVTPDRKTREFGVYGHGPDAEELAHQVVRHIQSWDGSSLTARIEAYPVDTPDDQLPEGALVLDKKHTRVVLSWP
ncbi:MAG: methyltransferase, FxLD system [Pseudonocardiaceae bacterium]